MFIRFREMTAERYGEGERACVGKCRDRPRYYPRYGIGMAVKGRTFLEGCPMKPLCPLVNKRRRLEVSIIETRREGGKVRQMHVASLGSIAGDSLVARDVFWRECEVRLARLSNRLGPHLDRLRHAIAERIPPLTDADREAKDTAAWQWLEAGWRDHAEGKARESSGWNETAKNIRREAIWAEAVALKVRQSRGDQQAFYALDMLLGCILAAHIRGGRHVDWDQVEAALKKVAIDL